MKLTNLLRMKLPEGKDPVNVEDFNDNFKAIDKELENMQTSAGDASKNTVTFSTAAERTNVASTETLGTIMGKIAKWFTDMKAAAFAGIANNETTNTDGFVLDARIGKKHSDQLNGLYFGTDAKGKWGFKTSQGGTVTPFRNPTGNAAAADVLSGKVFSSAELEDATGSMPNNGAWVGETTGNGNVAIPAGYHSGDGYVSGAGAYNKGVSDADGRVNTECASYKSGYANGYANAPIDGHYYIGTWTDTDSNRFNTVYITLPDSCKFKNNVRFAYATLQYHSDGAPTSYSPSAVINGNEEKINASASNGVVAIHTPNERCCYGAFIVFG